MRYSRSLACCMTMPARGRVEAFVVGFDAHDEVAQVGAEWALMHDRSGKGTARRLQSSRKLAGDEVPPANFVGKGTHVDAAHQTDVACVIGQFADSGAELHAAGAGDDTARVLLKDGGGEFSVVGGQGFESRIDLVVAVVVASRIEAQEGVPSAGEVAEDEQRCVGVSVTPG